MNVERGIFSQIEHEGEISRKEQVVKRKIPLEVSLGDQIKCPECRAMGRVVWLSENKKTMGVQCPASHRETIKPKSRYGATQVPSGKTRKNVVFLMPVA
jgi:hypothetical protein